MLKRLLVWVLGVALSGCFQPMKPSQGHLGAQPAPSAATIPPTVQALPTPPRPKPSVRPETYSVVVNNVSVRELLFALARDAKVNDRSDVRDGWSAGGSAVADCSAGGAAELRAISRG